MTQPPKQHVVAGWSAEEVAGSGWVVERAAVATVLAICVLRTTTVHDAFPGWGGSPLVLPATVLGVTPLLSVILDLLTLAASIVLFARSPGTRLRFALMLAIAGVAIAYHAGSGAGLKIDNLLLGGHWFAVIAAGLAVFSARRESGVRELAAAVCLGILPLLALRGAYQVWAEHPQTLAAFSLDPERYITAQGWDVGSPLALGFMRRLTQAEATGWFGLSNVYSSLMAGGTVCFIGLLAFSRGYALAARLACLLFAVVCGLGLWLSGSKGGFVAAAMGVAIVVVIRGWPKFGNQRGQGESLLGVSVEEVKSGWRGRLGDISGAFLAVGCTAGVLAVVAARGVVGERIGELSLLFRWFYLQAASAIIGEHPLIGVGPAGFKDAYLLFKNPISPEDITSPHSVLFDYVATLGVGGLALAAAWMALVIGAARAAVLTGGGTTPGARSGAGENREKLRWACGSIAVGVLAAAMLEQQVASPASTLVRLGGMVLGGVVAATVILLSSRPTQQTGADEKERSLPNWNAAGPALACGALAVAAHAQIELTMVTYGAAAWVGLLMASAGGGGRALFCGRPDLNVTQSAGAMVFARRNAGRFAAAAVALPTLWICATALPGVFRWDRSLQDANSSVYIVGDLVARRADYENRLKLNRFNGESSREIVGAIYSDLGDAVGHRIDDLPGSKWSFGQALDRLRVERVNAALPLLKTAAAAAPLHFRTQQAYHNLYMEAAILTMRKVPERAAEVRALAKETAQRLDTSTAWSWYATTLEQSAYLDVTGGGVPSAMPDVGARLYLAKARSEVIAAIERAQKLAPFEPSLPARLARLLASSGTPVPTPVGPVNGTSNTPGAGQHAGTVSVEDRRRAGDLARQALMLNERRRLDPLVQMSEGTKAELERIAGGDR